MLSEEEIFASCDENFVRAWQTMEQASPLFGRLLDAMAVMSLSTEDEAHVLVRSPSFSSIFSEPMPEWRENFLMRAERIDRARFLAACRNAIGLGTEQSLTVSWYNALPGHERVLAANINTLVSIKHVGKKDDVDFLYLAFKDISAMREAERDLTHSQYAVSLQAIFNEVVLIDVDDGHAVPIYLNGAPLKDENGACVDCGLHKVSKSVHPEDIRDFWKQVNANNVKRKLFGASPLPAIAFDFRRKEDDGEYHWVSIYLSRVERADDHRLVLLCLQNIDQKKEAQRRERELLSRAQRDVLTGIFNRGTTEEVISSRLRAHQEGTLFAFTVVDVDNFKAVNDTYGHQMGDEVLKCVADNLRKITRDRELVGRIGGDEFVALLEQPASLDIERLRTRLDRCMEEVHDATLNMGLSNPVTLSIGIVVIDTDDRTYYDAFSIADEMLYQAKREGKNQFVIHLPEDEPIGRGF